MPTPGQMANQQTQNPALLDLAKRIAGPMQAGDVAGELAALREEVAALRALLTPPSAVILTGPVVREHYTRLACTCMTISGPDYCMKHAA